MPKPLSTLISTAWAIFIKDAKIELRTRYTLVSLTMFSVIALSCVSMTISGVSLSSELAASLLWITIFFAAMAGLSRGFVAEEESGTLFTLKIYSQGLNVFLGKLLFNLLILFWLTILIVPLFILFINLKTEPLWIPFFLVLFLGVIGLAATSTLTAAMVIKAQGKHALFAVLTFPIILPLILSAVGATAKSLSGAWPGFKDLLFLFGFDVSLLAAAVLLFDFLWYE